ncbi:translation initiation factor IF-3 [Patescibacteria group bacterium]
MQIKRRRPKYNPKQVEKRTRINEWIKIPEVFLIDEKGDNVGVISTEKAKQMAKDVDLDLVEVNPKARPSVCKIMDYGKIKYEKEKQIHKQKIATKKSEIKGIRLTFKIKGHDLETRVKQAKKFLKAGNQVRVEMVLKGREKAHHTNAKNVIENFINELKVNEDQPEKKEEIKIMQPVQRQGGKFSAIVSN